MKKNILDKYVTEVSFISAFIVIIAMIILGVKNDYFYNYLITASCTGFSGVIASIIFSKKIYDMYNVSIIKLIIISILCIVFLFALGYLFEYLLLDKFLKINICAIEKGIAIIYKTMFAVFTSTIICYVVFSKIIKKELN